MINDPKTQTISYTQTDAKTQFTTDNILHYGDGRLYINIYLNGHVESVDVTEQVVASLKIVPKKKHDD